MNSWRPQTSLSTPSLLSAHRQRHAAPFSQSPSEGRLPLPTRSNLGPTHSAAGFARRKHGASAGSSLAIPSTPSLFGAQPSSPRACPEPAEDEAPVECFAAAPGVRPSAIFMSPARVTSLGWASTGDLVCSSPGYYNGAVIQHAFGPEQRRASSMFLSSGRPALVNTRLPRKGRRAEAPAAVSAEPATTIPACELQGKPRRYEAGTAPKHSLQPTTSSVARRVERSLGMPHYALHIGLKPLRDGESTQSIVMDRRGEMSAE